MQVSRHIDALKRVFDARKAKAPNYTLRTFAKDLGISAAFLSQIISGKRMPSEETAYRLARRLSLRAADQDEFVNTLRQAKVQNPAVKKQIRGELRRRLGDEEFAEIPHASMQLANHWLGFAISELFALEGAELTRSWMARKLGVPEIEVSRAIDRLVHVGILRERGGRLEKVVGNVTTPYLPSKAIRQYHHSILQKAAQAIDTQPLAERDFSSVTMAVDPTLIPAAMEKIRDFRRDLMEFLESGRQKKLYVLNVNLFRLDKDLPA